jgi:signal transduction histidine kinase
MFNRSEGLLKIKIWVEADESKPNEKGSEHPGYLFTKIYDKGIGITELQLAQIENKLNSKNLLENGYCGLLIARRLSESQKGNLKITSKKGEGTEVVFKVPYASKVSQ